MKELVTYIVTRLVDHPDDVEVSEISGERTTVFELRVNDEDLGKVIGRGGKTAKAIRTVLGAASVSAERRVLLEIVN